MPYGKTLFTCNCILAIVVKPTQHLFRSIYLKLAPSIFPFSNNYAFGLVSLNTFQSAKMSHSRMQYSKRTKARERENGKEKENKRAKRTAKVFLAKTSSFDVVIAFNGC